ncbi:GNAT family N-acetyltransferase [Sphingomonas bacterium]|uniref:GNAT family N-acetyltransferase n=1 Tax=Sphingomonas bacterium TaxID=1895847 RepID=UPI00260C71CD|nr:GNAT family N-acetyltransferase [Sphingomonas bacterium]MDB5678931.1 acyl-CoA N-acyltransferase [Sphingomonas bacterium]
MRVWLDGWLSTGLERGVPPTPAEMRARLDADLAKGDWMLTVAEADGVVVGMLATYPEKVDQLFLDPDWKGRGVGKALFAEAKRLMPEGFTLWSNTANDRARAFYERHGMTLRSLGPRPDKPDQIVAHYRWSPG